MADKAWNDAVAAAPGLAAGKGKAVERIERDGGTLYRTAVTGFADRAAATAFCNRLKAAGKSCFVR
ncbi:SPOR domain-containing protein [Phenylobacterium sp. J367]|uniref:SPOR domain-containing protein n=1 Tax=Phenylobacterium sp. J367 TaxID=2898435 RepID=UPI0027E302D6|nr:SPOR domain-containing protein [Phenylobacterium sp. J367]